MCSTTNIRHILYSDDTPAYSPRLVEQGTSLSDIQVHSHHGDSLRDSQSVDKTLFSDPSALELMRIRRQPAYHPQPPHDAPQLLHATVRVLDLSVLSTTPYKVPGQCMGLVVLGYSTRQEISDGSVLGTAQGRDLRSRTARHVSNHSATFHGVPSQPTPSITRDERDVLRQRIERSRATCPQHHVTRSR